MSRKYIDFVDTKPDGDYEMDIRYSLDDWRNQGLSSETNCDVCDWVISCHEWLQMDVDGIIQDCSRQHPKDGEIDHDERSIAEFG